MSEQPAPHENMTPHYVGFWIRFLAFLIDSTIASLLITPIAAWIIGAELELSLGDTAELQAQLGEMTTHLVVEMIIMGVIFVALWVWFSSTPGKMLFNAYIVDAKTYRHPSRTQLTIRYLGYFVNIFGFMLGFLWIAFDGQKQGWHDKMAGTVVIKGKPVSDQVADSAP